MYEPGSKRPRQPATGTCSLPLYFGSLNLIVAAAGAPRVMAIWANAPGSDANHRQAANLDVVVVLGNHRHAEGHGRGRDP